MAKGTAWSCYCEALKHALARVVSHWPDFLIVSLGVDTFKDDPIGHFLLASDDFHRMGKHIAAAGIPTLFVMEGGYMVDDIGLNAVNTLQGFESDA